MATQKVELFVEMMCGGCANAVKRVLSKADGVQEVDADWENNKVTVTGDVDAQALIDIVAKTGKETRLWTA